MDIFILSCQDQSYKFKSIPRNFICKLGATTFYVEECFMGHKKTIFALVNNTNISFKKKMAEGFKSFSSLPRPHTSSKFFVFCLLYF